MKESKNFGTLHAVDTKDTINTDSCTMTNRIEDIKNKRDERMNDAVFFSNKISSYIQYLTITKQKLI